MPVDALGRKPGFLSTLATTVVAVVVAGVAVEALVVLAGKLDRLEEEAENEVAVESEEDSAEVGKDTVLVLVISIFPTLPNWLLSVGVNLSGSGNTSSLTKHVWGFLGLESQFSRSLLQYYTKR
jgi:hypothetical protein